MTASVLSSNAQLAKLLAQQGLLPAEVLDGLSGRAQTLQEWLGQVAADDGLLSYQEIAEAISTEMRIPLDHLALLQPDPRALDHIAADTCLSHCAAPIGFEDAGLVIVMANPLDEMAVQTLRGIAGCEIVVHVAARNEILDFIDSNYQSAFGAAIKPQPDAFTLQYPGMDFVESQQLERPAGGMGSPSDMPTLDDLLMEMMQNHASDLHLAVGSPPMMRVDGELRPMSYPVLKPATLQPMIYAILSDVQVTEYERNWELDMAYSLPGISRFRVNVLRQRGSIGAVLRTIPMDIPTLDKLNMPPIVRELTGRPRGLVLVTGPTGSGKSTTLAAMVAEINQTRRSHIVTIEDPIEFLHSNKMSVITQREVGADTTSFTTALRHVLRQDPDVILIGEMRDLETISAAVTAAETGHLVFATLHTTSAAQTIERIIDVFPPHQQDQIRSQLSNVLEAIFTQTLLPNQNGKGRCCAMEILMSTSAVRNLVREGKIHQIPSVIQASAKYGMITLDASLKQLVLDRKVSLEEAIKKASNPDDFKALVAMQ
jgi:twitching motility protein PilT